MGEASLALGRLDLDRPHEILLSLAEPGKSEYLGQLALSVRLESKRTIAAVRSNSSISLLSSLSSVLPTASASSVNRDSMQQRRPGGGRMAPWAAVVNIVLVEGRDLLAMDVEGTSDPYCKFRQVALLLLLLVIP